MRVKHPHHPQRGQVLKVLRESKHPAYAERRWVVLLPDGKPGGMPFSWAVPAENYTAEEKKSEAEDSTLRAGVKELLSLATLCSVLESVKPEEAANGKEAAKLSTIPKTEEARKGASMACAARRKTPESCISSGNDVAEQRALSTGVSK